ncbi:tRNA (adenosine(37)-N6)-threonylcarbamoyltransferase complex dimerization subunit type 1 TsaB [Cellvibrio zantedeschiae]|uniref:tRNA threonylcarbamoyladenosine biosynthesis protein TsaB n=1 Tax=Cellvibrio zantedeschiae TaxID=1237077 RepID=A0ABQ3AT93_9GAMM|nr:tRNA (adenosine(37)-N6)-threonylcarbamoyltransferase complex dimerization subunit type 1 TsaB [Cellvibrio zantedeschiae]GGY67129.1 tRNA (adenosine(37)-N6)-threonylcarbamoyltransferase complex dimerization subunit type 1 TsaB [Cellvibrio zantedeschiae]
MTKILALDASTDACSVALSLNGETTHIFELAAKSHTQRLLPMVDEILRAANCTLHDLDAIAFGRGPGSFTGLRICIGIVQGLAFGANLPVIPVSTLQAMAQGFVAQNQNADLPLLVALDARMDEIYWGLFSADNIPNLLGTEHVMKPAKVGEQHLIANLEKQFIAIGPGWHYADLQNIVPEVLIQDVHPDARFMLPIALDAFDKGETQSIFDAQPVYLRDSVSWQKRQRIRTQSL